MTIFIIWNISWRDFACSHHVCCACAYLISHVAVNRGLWAQANYIWTFHWLQLVWYKTSAYIIHIFLQLDINISFHFHKVKTEKFPHIIFCQSSRTAWAQSWWIYKQTFCSEVRVFAHINPPSCFSNQILKINSRVFPEIVD